MKILLLGGTKDSTNIIEFIKSRYDAYILTTTTTEYGAKLAMQGGSDDTACLSNLQIKAKCQQHP